MRKLIFIQLSLWLMLPFSAMAEDGFAGPDKEIVSVSCGDDKSKGVRIGTVAYAEGGCFKWTPETGLEDASSGVTNASPTESTTYKLTWTKADGTVSIDHVIVKVSAQLEGSPTVKAKKCCFEDGDEIKVADFEFSPSGIEECITVVTQTAGGNNVGEGKQTIEFTFKAGEEDPVSLSTEINVSPKFNPSLGDVTGLSDKAKQVNDIVKSAKMAVDVIKKSSESASKLSGKVTDDGNGIQNELEFEYDIKAYECCKECKTESSYGVTTSMKLNGKFGVAYQYDFPGYGIPYVASVGLTAGFSTTVEAGASLSYTFFCDESKVEFPYSAAFEVNGGAFGQVGNRWLNIVRVQLTINAGVNAKSAIKYKKSGWDNGWDEIKTCFDVKAVGTIKTFGLGETKVERVLFNHCL